MKKLTVDLRKLAKVRKDLARRYPEIDRVIDKKTGEPCCPHCGTRFKKIVDTGYSQEWAIDYDCLGKRRGMRLCIG